VSEIIKGEAVIAREDYDLFGVNVNGFLGIFIRKDKHTGKHLIYFPILEEWGEIINIERVQEGVVSEENQKFANRVCELNYSMKRFFYGFGEQNQ
jgi:hypothetical protein|tara:strand:+ start:308 stop:592 length:285 start_codon:yes stop_codon:yes gene_type:complete